MTRFLFFFLFFFLFAISGGSAAYAQIFRAEVLDVPLERQAAYWVSEWRTVELPAGLASFQIIVQGSADSLVQVTDLIAPDGTRFVRSTTGDSDVLNAWSEPVLTNVISPERSEGVMNGTGSLIVPNSPSLPALQAGTWRFRSHSRREPARKSVSFSFIGKLKTEAPRKTIPLHVWVAPGSYWTADDHRVEKLIEQARKVYARYDLHLELKAIDLLDHAIANPLHLPDDVTAIAMVKNDLQAINAYLLPKMEFQTKPINGLACLGGPVGFARPHACFVSMYAAEKADEVTLEQQGKILVHEIGHYLGLFHTQDQGYYHLGTIYDPLDDTPEEITGANLMDPGIHNADPVFSPKQVEMIRLSPALQP